MKRKLLLFSAIPLAVLAVLVVIFINLVVYIIWPFQKLWNLYSQIEVPKQCENPNPVCPAPDVESVDVASATYFVAAGSGSVYTYEKPIAKSDEIVIVEYRESKGKT
ncbi:MAG: hypothetical protein HYW65_01025 [Candidatus Liptonbacteria bacterium]|nr:hypothetical protein [Candidatus Liptonbacteria bacterium]